MFFRESGENIHVRLFFIADSESVLELKKALHADQIVINRGKQLEDLIDRLMGDPGIKKDVTFDHSTPFKGTAPISTYTHAKCLGIVVCQDFCQQLFISSKKKGNYHKQDLNFSQEQLVLVTKLSDADMASFG